MAVPEVVISNGKVIIVHHANRQDASIPLEPQEAQDLSLRLAAKIAEVEAQAAARAADEAERTALETDHGAPPAGGTSER